MSACLLAPGGISPKLTNRAMSSVFYAFHIQRNNSRMHILPSFRKLLLMQEVKAWDIFGGNELFLVDIIVENERIKMLNIICHVCTMQINTARPWRRIRDIILFAHQKSKRKCTTRGCGVIELYCFTNRIHLYYSHKDNLHYFHFLLFRFANSTSPVALFIQFCKNDIKMPSNSPINGKTVIHCSIIENWLMVFISVLELS